MINFILTKIKARNFLWLYKDLQLFRLSYWHLSSETLLCRFLMPKFIFDVILEGKEQALSFFELANLSTKKNIWKKYSSLEKKSLPMC